MVRAGLTFTTTLYQATSVACELVEAVRSLWPKAFHDHKPVFLRYKTPSPFSAGDAVGNVSEVTYEGRGSAPGALNRLMCLMDDSRARVTECAKPETIST